jgi:hypothetical protein
MCNPLTAQIAFPLMFPPVEPRTVAYCTGGGGHDAFKDDLTQIHTLKPVRHHRHDTSSRKSHRLVEEQEHLCTKHLTKFLAQKEF